MLEVEELVNRKAPSQVHYEVEDKWMQRGLAVFTVAYMGLLTWFCCVKVMAFDELLSLYTARASSAAQLLQFQRTAPVSLDPPLLHLLGYWAIHLGIDPTFAVRLPSLLGAALMVVCMYIFARRLAGQAAASFTVVGLFIADQFHMVEARPYGVLLGLSALALVLWQNALRHTHRRASMLGLFAVLGAAISSHYFGILLVVPFLLAECVRTLRRRRVDAALVPVLTTSPIFPAGWMPFLAGAHQYKSNYYIKVRWTDLSRSYTALFQRTPGSQTGLGEAFIVIAVLALIGGGAWLGYRTSRRLQPSQAVPEDALTEWVAVAAFALLPIAGVLLAMVASGAFEIRYVIEFTLGTTLCLAAGLAGIVHTRTLRNAILVAGCVVAVASLGIRARQDAAAHRALHQLARATREGPTLFTDKEEFLWLHAAHDVDIDPANVLWVADLDHELAASGSDNIDRTMINLKTMAGLPVISWPDATPAFLERRLIIRDGTNPVNWLPSALAASGMQITAVETVGPDHIFEVQRAPAQPGNQ